MAKRSDEEFSDEEAERRAREAICRSFDMPHKPQKDLVSHDEWRALNEPPAT